MGWVALTRDGKVHFASRIKNLIPQTKRQWGTMEHRGMVAHLRRSLEVSMGEITIADQSTWLSRTLIRPMALTFIPIPKNAKAPGEFFEEPEGTLEDGKARLMQTIDRYFDVCEKEPQRLAAHPLFGPLTLKEWCGIHGKHFDHHLRQFSF